MPKSKYKIGLIAEDPSDIESLKELIHRILNYPNISIIGMGKNGCATLRRKCLAWADILFEKGCTLLIVVHDSDGNSEQEILEELNKKISQSSIKKKQIVVPVQEIESWLLKDPQAIMSSLKLSKIPKIKSDTQTIQSPKEYLEKLVITSSNGEKEYINSRHNQVIAKHVSIDLLKQCSSFMPLYNFLVTNIK